MTGAGVGTPFDEALGATTGGALGTVDDGRGPVGDAWSFGVSRPPQPAMAIPAAAQVANDGRFISKTLWRQTDGGKANVAMTLRVALAHDCPHTRTNATA